MPPRIFDGMYEGWRRATLEWLGQVCGLIGVCMFALAVLRLGEWQASDPEVWMFGVAGIFGVVAAFLLIAVASSKE